MEIVPSFLHVLKWGLGWNQQTHFHMWPNLVNASHEGQNIYSS